MSRLPHLNTSFGEVFLLCTVAIVVCSRLAHGVLKAHRRRGALPLQKKYALVIAHPDDETMFFLPTCLNVNVVKIICLSDGNADGLGLVRRKELENTAAELKIPKVIIGIFRDGFNEIWSPSMISDVLEQECDENEIIVTFDSIGVSHHPNHVAVHLGVQYYVHRLGRKTLFLQSDISPIWKFSGMFGAAWTVLSTRKQHDKRGIFFINDDMLLAYRLMCIHRSQLVWYRRLFVIFARCVFINQLTEG